jgi:hypothetical protein
MWENKWTQWSDDKAGKWLLLFTRAVARLIGCFWLTAVLACLICDSQAWFAGRGKSFAAEYFYSSTPKAVCLQIFFLQVSLNLDVQLKNVYDRETVLVLWWYFIQGSWGWEGPIRGHLPSFRLARLELRGGGEKVPSNSWVRREGGRLEVGHWLPAYSFLDPIFPCQMLVTRALRNSRYSLIHRCTQLTHEWSIFIQLLQIRNW